MKRSLNTPDGSCIKQDMAVECYVNVKNVRHVHSMFELALMDCWMEFKLSYVHLFNSILHEENTRLNERYSCDGLINFNFSFDPKLASI